MKATVDIPSDELRDAMRFTKSKTKREAIRLEPELANAVLCRRVRHGPQQRKAAPLGIDRVLPSGKCHVPAAAALPTSSA